MDCPAINQRHRGFQFGHRVIHSSVLVLAGPLKEKLVFSGVTTCILCRIQC